MTKTFETLKTLAREYNGGKKDKDLVVNYNNRELQDRVISYIFCTNYSLFMSKARKFSVVLTTDDLESLILQAISDSIKTYKVDSKKELKFYIADSVYFTVRHEAQMVRKGDVEYFLNSTRFEETTEGHDGEASIMEMDNEVAVACSCEDNHDKFELTSLIDSLNLSEKQKNYLQIVIANPSLKDIEVAKILGVGRNSISMMKKRIREKISVFGLN